MRLLSFVSTLCTFACAAAATMLRGTVLVTPPLTDVQPVTDAVALPLPAMVDIEHEFASWMDKFNVHFDSAEEYTRRFAVFADNHLQIWAHNLRGTETVVLAHNQFSHLTLDEFATQHLGGQVPSADTRSWMWPVNADELYLLMANETFLPASVDWVAAGAVTPVKDQGQCGSCWSFSTTGGIEGANFIKSGKLISLSEQQLVDCDTATNQGCNGGFMDDAFTYIKGNGLTTEAAYPYKAVQGACAISGKTLAIAVGAVKGFVDVPSGDENALQAAVAQQPVSVAIQANQIAFQFYSSGVLTGTCGKRLDHGVLAVGYGVDGSTPYWKVKNSWSASWGEGGYIRIQRGTDKCGIADAASYPLM
jgi:C1A family cysteine protease